MSPRDLCSRSSLALALMLWPALWLACGQDPDGHLDRRSDVQLPSAQEVAALLKREPITPQSWPAWRGRLLAWIDERGHLTDAAYFAAWMFFKDQARDGRLPPNFADDAFAWYLLGSAYLYDASKAADPAADAVRAEQALRESLKRDPKLARSHVRLARALLLQARKPEGGNVPRMEEVRREMALARTLQPDLPMLSVAEAEVAFAENRLGDAERHLQQATREDPESPDLARALAMAIVGNRNRAGPRAPVLRPLADRFPDDGELACFYGAALAQDGDARGAAAQFERARALGVDPAALLGAENVRRLEEAAAPSLLERFGWIMLWFGIFYAVVMLVMAAAGVTLAAWTRGSRALQLLGAGPVELVAEGQVLRTSEESRLAKLYALALILGLVLFYAAIPLVVVGLLGATGLLLYLIFQAGHIPVKLVLFIILIGGGMAWAVFRSLFVRSGQGSFGIPKSAADCPRLHAVVSEVAQRVNTRPVDEIYLAPAAAIGVHQEGRGPFGIFGVKRRVLTFGLSTLHFLTISELKAILAHEYAHFSHGDTFYSRFIYQVTLSIQQALSGMGAAGGRINYVNPFFWFLYLYYKTYSMLAGGFSRSREFLADRMASSLYGSAAFASGLTKVATDGTLFEMTVYDNISQLLDKNQAFLNVYDAFRSYRNEQLSAQQRNEMYQKLLAEEASLFASHPTFKERIEAVAHLPRDENADNTSALTLFENPEEIEKELTEFLTGVMHHVRQLQAEAAQAQG